MAIRAQLVTRTLVWLSFAWTLVVAIAMSRLDSGGFAGPSVALSLMSGLALAGCICAELRPHWPLLLVVIATSGLVAISFWWFYIPAAPA